jgi:hypothetical protein
MEIHPTTEQEKLKEMIEVQTKDHKPKRTMGSPTRRNHET